jgi:adenylate cyclase
LVFQSLEATRLARGLLKKAIELDPGLAEAHAWLAVSHYFGWLYFGESDEDRKLARTAASKALSLDPENPDAHIVHGYVRAYEGELAQGVAEIEQALRVNPNHATGWGMLADLRVFEGRAEEAIECARNGFRLDPHAPPDTDWQLGWALYAAGRFEETVETLHSASAQTPGVRRILAAALAQLGRVSEAREEARKYLLDFPHFSAGQWGRTQPFRNDADRQHFIDGYVKAGLPE